MVTTHLVEIRGKRETLDIVVIDPDHRQIQGLFSYVAIPGIVSEVFLVGIAVTPSADQPIEGLLPLTVTDMRDLPLARWEQAARARLTALIREDPRLISTQRRVDELRAITERATATASRRRDIKPSSRRQARSHERLLKVADEYRANLMAGRPDPVAEIARRHDVNPSTARSWVHRARQLGFLDPAIGRTAGEAPRRGRKR